MSAFFLAQRSIVPGVGLSRLGYQVPPQDEENLLDRVRVRCIAFTGRHIHDGHPCRRLE